MLIELVLVGRFRFTTRRAVSNAQRGNPALRGPCRSLRSTVCAPCFLFSRMSCFLPFLAWIVSIIGVAEAVFLPLRKRSTRRDGPEYYSEGRSFSGGADDIEWDDVARDDEYARTSASSRISAAARTTSAASNTEFWQQVGSDAVLLGDLTAVRAAAPRPTEQGYAKQIWPVLVDVGNNDQTAHNKNVAADAPAAVSAPSVATNLLCSVSSDTATVVGEETQCPKACPYTQPILGGTCEKYCVTANGCAHFHPARSFADPVSRVCVLPCGQDSLIEGGVMLLRGGRALRKGGLGGLQSFLFAFPQFGKKLEILGASDLWLRNCLAETAQVLAVTSSMIHRRQNPAAPAFPGPFCALRGTSS